MMIYQQSEKAFQLIASILLSLLVTCLGLFGIDRPTGRAAAVTACLGEDHGKEHRFRSQLNPAKRLLNAFSASVFL